MLIQIWLTLTLIASACTYYTLTDRLPIVIGAATATLLWGVLAFGGLNIVVVDGGAIAYQQPNQVLAFLALGGAVINLLYLFADATGQLTGEARPIRGER